MGSHHHLGLGSGWISLASPSPHSRIPSTTKEPVQEAGRSDFLITVGNLRGCSGAAAWRVCTD
ncbi:hypothetical protein A33M_2268 [Rhodovulum sp. PH10]|nr:hypothetical protein A33M_2268 [Rhodovulum sp. PH10]